MKTPCTTLMILWVALLGLLSHTGQSFTTPLASTHAPITTKHLQLYFDHHHEQHDATPLPLTAADRQRLAALQRTATMPLLIIDQALVPRQELVLQVPLNSPDAVTMVQLVQHVVPTSQPVALVGRHQGRALSHGVTAVCSDPVAVAGHLRVAVKAVDRITLTGTAPQRQENQTFYTVTVQTQPTDAPLTTPQRQHTAALAKLLPALVQEWKDVADKHKLDHVTEMDSSDLPHHKDNHRYTDQAWWVAALLHPTTPPPPHAHLLLPVDIRPAMLAAPHDYDRLVLAVQALQTSMAHLRRRDES